MNDKKGASVSERSLADVPDKPLDAANPQEVSFVGAQRTR